MTIPMSSTSTGHVDPQPPLPPPPPPPPPPQHHQSQQHQQRHAHQSADSHSNGSNQQNVAPSGIASNTQNSYSWTINGRRLRAPKLIRALFDTFPILVYPPEILPLNISQSKSSHRHQLYIFTSPKDAREGGPSFNPTCLRWQTYLKMCNVKFDTIASSNHASPSGALPFVLTTSTQDINRKVSKIIPSSQLAKWIQGRPGASRSKPNIDLQSPDTRAFMSLLDTKIKNAWLYSLYIQPNNFTNITRPNYTQAVSTWPIPIFLGLEMQSAAEMEILRSCGGSLIRPDELFTEAEIAFQALSTLLGQEQWFFSSSEPGLFDAAVFGYSHLLLHMPLHSREDQLKASIMNYENLVAHRDRILSRFF